MCAVHQTIVKICIYIVRQHKLLHTQVLVRWRWIKYPGGGIKYLRIHTHTHTHTQTKYKYSSISQNASSLS